jgi:predicted ester cyclase
MTVIDNAAALRRAIENWNAGDLGSYLGLYAPHIVLHSVPAGVPSGVEGVKKMYQGMWSSYPGSTIQIEDLFQEGERVACRYTVRATSGATGEQVTFIGITILHFSNGVCVERWDMDRKQK